MTDASFTELPAALGLWQHDGLHPLTAILGYTHLLQREFLGPLTEQQQQAIETIRMSTHRAMEVWHRSAAYLNACDLRYPPEPIVMEDLFADIHQRLHVYGITVAATLPEHLPRIHGYHQLLNIAFCSLLYPLDQLPSCTNTSLRCIVDVQADTTLRVQLTSALRLNAQEQDVEQWLSYPGSCLNTAARIVGRHDATMTTTATAEGVLFTLVFPLNPS
jgi:hypothetical protein